MRPAIYELHQAKIDWWHGDTLRGALLSLHLLSQWYRRLGLPAAAKQQALTMANVAAHNNDPDIADLIAAGTLQAAAADYAAGAWASALEHLRPRKTPAT